MERDEEHYKQCDEKRGCERHADLQEGLHEGIQDEVVMKPFLLYAQIIEFYNL